MCRLEMTDESDTFRLHFSYMQNNFFITYDIHTEYITDPHGWWGGVRLQRGAACGGVAWRVAATCQSMPHTIEDHCSVLSSPEPAMPMYFMIMRPFLGRVSLRLTSRTRK